MKTAPTDPDASARLRFKTVFDRTFLVEAGAGTGKTTLLVDRLVSALARGVTDAPGLVAITFTERAAAELQIRIRQALEQAVTRGVASLPAHTREGLEGIDPAAPEVDKRLRKALAELDRAHISTIHAFCHEMLVTRPLEAGVDPAGTGLDNEALQKRVKEEVTASWLEAQEAGEEAVRGWVDLGFRTDDVCGMALALFEQVDLLDAMNVAPEAFEARAEQEALRQGRKALEAFIAKYAVKRGATQDDLEAFLGVLGGITSAGTEEAFTEALASLPDAWNVSFRRPGKTHWDGGKARGEEAVQLAKQIRDRLSASVRALQSPVFCAGLAWLRDRVRETRRNLQRAGVLGFSDLLLLARDLLRDHREVRRFFQKRFRLILVDEFQDTDPLQAEIAFFLAGEGADAGDWRTCAPAPGKLSLVADPKQSIYRFRRADIQIYLYVKQRIGGLPHGEILSIARNFRSLPSVVTWVNGVFPALIRPVPGKDVQAPYTPLAAHRPAESRPGVYLFGETLEGKRGEVRRKEQEAIARIVGTVCGNESFPVRDRRTGEVRAPRYGDVAVLFPKRTGYESVEETFSTRGIPYVSDVGPAFYAREEIQELVSVLRAVERPHDPVLLYAALHSPLFGFGDDDLAVLCDGGPLDLKRSDASLPEAFRAPFRLLRTLHAERNRRGVARTLRDLLEACRAPALLGGDDRYGPRKVAHLEGLVARAARADAQERWSFADFVDEIAEAVEEEVKEEGELPLTFGGEDVTALLTFHQAKGLEFPVVILANLCSGLEFGGVVKAETLVRRIPETALHLRCGAHHTQGFEEAREEEEALEAAEKARQLYVACTRARDYLFVTRAGGGAPGSYGGLLAEGGEGEASVFEEAGEEGAPASGRKKGRKKFTEALLEQRRAWSRAREDLLRRRDERIEVIHPSSAKAGTGPAPETPEAEFEEPARVEPPAPGGGGTGGETPDRRSARLFGTAFHRLMEEIDLGDARSASSPASFARTCTGLARRIAREEGLGKTASGDLASCLEKTAASEIFRRALEADRVLRETPILFPGEGGRPVEGDVDLAFREGEAWVVVDYKTDATDDAKASAETYRNQLDLYAQGIRAATGVETVERWVLFARTGEAVRLP